MLSRSVTNSVLQESDSPLHAQRVVAGGWVGAGEICKCGVFGGEACMKYTCHASVYRYGMCISYVLRRNVVREMD